MPNLSLERTCNGIALGPRDSVAHHLARGPSTLHRAGSCRQAANCRSCRTLDGTSTTRAPCSHP